MRGFECDGLTRRNVVFWKSGQFRRGGHMWRFNCTFLVAISGWYFLIKNIYGIGPITKLTLVDTFLQPDLEKTFKSSGKYDNSSAILLMTCSSATGRPFCSKSALIHIFTWDLSKGRNGTKKSMRFFSISDECQKPPLLLNSPRLIIASICLMLMSSLFFPSIQCLRTALLIRFPPVLLRNTKILLRKSTFST